MSIDDTVSVIIPAFNEESTLARLLSRVRETLSDVNIDHEIIVVDDGSTDTTSSVAVNTPAVECIRHPYNKGNGAAVKSGIMRAGGRYIVIMDADGQHDPEYLPELIGHLSTYDLVVGSRDSFGIGKRGLGNILVSRLASYLSGIEIPDLTSGFRTFHKEKMLEFFSLLPNGFSLPSTSTLAFAVNGYNIKFVPIRAHARQGGKSGIRIIRDGMKFTVLILRMVSLFKPLKIFAPTSVILTCLGLFWSVRVYIMSEGISSLGTNLILAGLLTFLFGLLADQLAETRFSIGKIINTQSKGRQDVPDK